MRKLHFTLAGTLTLVTGSLIASTIYFAYIFPKTIDRTAQVLPFTQRFMLNAGQFCWTFRGMILSIILIGFIGALTWLAYAVRIPADANNT